MGICDDPVKIRTTLDSERRRVLRRYAIALWILAFVFFLRVLGQLLVAIFDVAFLPPMAAWYSGILPYHALLPIQIMILAAQMKIGSDFSRREGFFVMPRRRMGTTLRWFSYMYFTSMLLRYIITRTLLIPIVFHWVLAVYLFVLGNFYASRDAIRQDSIAGGVEGYR